MTTERADLAPLREGTDQVDHFDPGLEDRGLDVLVDELGCGAMDRIAPGGRHGTPFIDRVADDVEHASEDLLAHGNGNRGIGGDDLQPALQPFGGGHRDGAHPAVTEMLLHLEGQRGFLAARCEIDCERLVDRGQTARGAEVDIDDGADDLDNGSDSHERCGVWDGWFRKWPFGRWRSRATRS